MTYRLLRLIQNTSFIFDIWVIQIDNKITEITNGENLSLWLVLGRERGKKKKVKRVLLSQRNGYLCLAKKPITSSPPRPLAALLVLSKTVIGMDHPLREHAHIR